jgi:hypothetical protein
MAILQASNLILTDGQEETTLTVAAASGATTLTVFNIQDFAISNYILIGDWGDDDAEIIQLHAATAPTGTTITLVAGGLARSHSVGDKVKRINFNQVEFSRYVAVGDAPSVLTTKATEADDEYTSYNDTTNATGYWRFRFKNSTTTVYTSYSGYFAYTGPVVNSVEQMKRDALDLTNEEISDLITNQYLLNQLNHWQREIEEVRNWSWETATHIDTVSSGQMEYDLPTDMKHAYSPNDIIQIRIKNYTALANIDKKEYDEKLVDTIYSTLAGNVALIDTTITLTDSSDFPNAGSITIGNDTIDFTANDTTTNILSGVTGITSTHATGDTVWTTTSLDQPMYYAITNGHYYLFPIADSTLNGLSITLDYYKWLDSLTSDVSVTTIPFYGIAQYYLAWKIMERKGNTQAADRWRQIYENRLSSEMKRDQPVNYGRFTLARTKGAG